MKYKIIDITDNKGGSDGHIIMVKANPVKDAPGFAHLTKLFGKKYYTYSMMDDSETEIFVYPFSERLAHDLTTQAQNEGQKKDFWEPEDDDFYDADWCGILIADLQTQVFIPEIWYEPEIGPMQDTLFNDIEFTEEFATWAKHLIEQKPLIIPDTEKMKFMLRSLTARFSEWIVHLM